MESLGYTSQGWSAHPGWTDCPALLSSAAKCHPVCAANSPQKPYFSSGRRKVVGLKSDGTVHAFERVLNEHGSRLALHDHAGSKGARPIRVRYGMILLTHCG